MGKRRYRQHGNSLGVASLILGAVAFLFCWAPCIGVLSVPLAVVGLLLALIGFVVCLARGGAGVGYPIAGGVVNAVAVATALLVSTVFFKAFDESMRERIDAAGTAERVATTVVVDDATESRIVIGELGVPVTIGDFDVRVLGVSVAPVRVRRMFDAPEGGSRSVEPVLVVRLAVSNLSPTARASYAGYGDPPKATIVRDEHGNAYSVVRFEYGSRVVGAAAPGDIYPGQRVEDVVVFERPVDAAQTLTLDLSADRFGERGVVRFEITADQITR